MQGKRSWRSATRDGELKYLGPLKNHMEKHFTAPGEVVLREMSSQYDSLVSDSVQELQQEMMLAPPELKPLYAVAIQNLVGLKETKPSQQHLIQALKAIHEIRGMKMEQQLLLEYSKHFAIDVASQPAIEV